jgi:SSS family solute:Na+ symporter
VLAGFAELTRRVPDHFDMILSPDNPHYKDLPGIAVLVGGMWIANLSYWGFNQYIIQRALAAKSLGEAQKGVIFAGFLKLLMPVIIVLPGIAAVVLAPNLAKPDQAYPTMMALLPTGLLGLVFAALIAAIIASTASKINSIATIFTLDIYAKLKGVQSRAARMKAARRRMRSISCSSAGSPQWWRSSSRWRRRGRCSAASTRRSSISRNSRAS